MNKYELKGRLRNLCFLYVENSLERRTHFAKIFKSYGCKLYTASNSDEAINLYDKVSPDILVTEVSNGGMNILHSIRHHDKNLRIIVMSIHSKIEYLTEAVELDISRYLIQPVSNEKLESALKKVVSELSVFQGDDSFCLDENLYYQANIKSITNDGEQVSLNKKEAKLLDLFLEHSNSLLSYQDIQKHIWPNSDVTNASLRTLVKNLRKKGTAHLIQNISGSGYIFQLVAI